jgi:peptidoglycan hydrolase-like protein with peptidoglycan-binding domain
VPRNAGDPAAASRAQMISSIQRELSRRGFYDGGDDGIWGAKTDAAARDFAQAAGLKTAVEASETFLRAMTASKVQAKPGKPAPAQAAAHEDQIAKLLAPSERIRAVQRALAEFGYGQIAASGLYDPQTRAAIERFQQARSLPVNGQITDETVRELAAVTGRPLE